ncbi:MAG: lytic murein transglycosylase [bacterium]|nr:lytic murein transglycosylase [bacterium]
MAPSVVVGKALPSARVIEPAMLNNMPQVPPATLVVKPALRGWDYLVYRLQLNGMGRDEAENIFSDPRMPKRDELLFNARPAESKVMYRLHNAPRTRANALKFYSQYKQEFLASEKKYSVPREVILAILQVETHCGQVTGKERVIHRLARLASASTPDNVIKNIKHNKKLHKGIREDEISNRAQWLEDTFLPQVIGTVRLAEELGKDPLEIRGSSAGAVGFPQFLPGNVILYGVDADKNGRIDPYTPVDAIHSVGSFLNAKGWKNLNLPRAERRKVVLHYNKSEPYVDTVLTMGEMLKKQMR